MKAHTIIIIVTIDSMVSTRSTIYMYIVLNADHFATF